VPELELSPPERVLNLRTREANGRYTACEQPGKNAIPGSVPADGNPVVVARDVPGNAACGTPRRPPSEESDAAFIRALAHQLNHV